MGEADPLDTRGRPSSGGHRKRQSTGRRRGGPARSSDEGPATGPERRVPGRSGRPEANPQGEEPRGGPKRTVRSHASEAGLWEPYDGRLSRTVLREPGGEIPPGYSPYAVKQKVDAGGPRSGRVGPGRRAAAAA